MKRLLKLTGSGYHLLFLLVFTVLFAYIMRYTVLFGDDYYYAAFVPSGWEFFRSENIFHYLNTNGRAWVHILDELLLATKDTRLFAPFNTFVAAALAVVLAKAAQKEDKDGFRPALAAVCVLLSLIGIQNAYQSVFWATGAMNYFFPMLLSLSYFILLKSKRIPRVLAPALALLASSSSEQAAFLALCTTLFYGALYIKDKKRPDAVYIISAVLSVAGFVVLFAAPGNAVRTGYYPDFYAMPFFTRIAYNLPILENLFFSKAGTGDVLLFWFVAEALSEIGQMKVAAITKTVLSLVGAVSYYGLLHLGFPHFFIHISAATALAVLVFDTVFSLLRRNYSRAFFLFTAAALQLAMLLSPEIGPRTVLCSCILIMIPTAELAAESVKLRAELALPAYGLLLFLVTLPGIITTAVAGAAVVAAVVSTLCRKSGYAKAALLVLLAVLAADRLYTIVCGYRENYPVHERNAESVAEYKENGGELTIYYLKNADFKYIMPYENAYHEYWFKRCFGIDENAAIVYKDFAD